MEEVADYHYLGLLAVAIIIVGLVLTPLLWPQGMHKTFSQHIAVHKKAIIYYITLFSIALPLLLLFFIGWFIPTFQLPIGFSVLIILSCLLQYTCTLIPESGGWKTRWHRAFAGLSAILLIVPLIFLYFSSTVSFVGQVLALACIIIMLGIIAVTKVGKEHPYLLPLQATYYCAFFLPILVISYL